MHVYIEMMVAELEGALRENELKILKKRSEVMARKMAISKSRRMNI